MNKSKLIVILLISACPAFSQVSDTARVSQNTFNISGIVQNNENQKPLAYATIGIKGKSMGVVSNQDGAFEFNVPLELVNDTLQISMLGYEIFENSLTEYLNKNNVIIKLVEKPVLLREVVINEKELTGREIVEKAVENIKNNYPQSPYMMEAFYRHHMKEGKEYTGLYEAALNIYDKKYSTPVSKHRQREKVYLMEVRKSKTSKFRGRWYDEMNMIYGLLVSNDVKYVKNALDTRREKYELIEYLFLDDKLVYKIETNAPWTHFLYIDADDYAILKVEMSAKWEGEEQNEWIRQDTIKYRAKLITKLYQFKQINGVYLPSFLNYKATIEGFHTETNKRLFITESYQELMINNIKMGKIEQPDKGLLMYPYESLEIQPQKYNPAFWESYNIIKETPLDKRILSDLEKENEMEDQFQANSSNQTPKRTTVYKKRKKNRIKNGG